MACNNCGGKEGIPKSKVVSLNGIFNKVLAVYCTNCKNLMYGYCRPIR